MSNSKIINSYINLQADREKYTTNLISNINLLYNPNDYLWYNQIIRMNLKIIKQYVFIDKTNYLNIKFLHYDCIKWKTNNIVSFANFTNNKNFYNLNSKILVENGSNLNQNIKTDMLVSKGNITIDKTLKSIKKTIVRGNLKAKQIQSTNRALDTLKIENDFLIIKQKNDSQEIGIEINDNNKYPKFVWKNGNNGWQFYCVDKDNNLLPFIFSPDYFSDKYIEKTGDRLTGNLLMDNNPTQPLHQVTKGYVDFIANSQTTQIETHKHDEVYLKRAGGQFLNGVKLNLNFYIDWNQEDTTIQINKKVWDEKISIHNHDNLYVKRTGDTLLQNLEIQKKQYVNLNQLTTEEQKRIQTKFDVDSRQQSIINYNHTNYLFKTKSISDTTHINYTGQIFLKKLPRLTDETKNDFVNKQYVDIISGKSFNGFFKIQFLDINLGWVSQMYEYTFDLQSWYNSYYNTLPAELKSIYGQIDQYIVYPIVTYKTIRFTNSNLGQYKGQNGVGYGSDRFVNYKVCKPNYYSIIEDKKCMFKFKLRLGQFGVMPITTGNTYTYSNSTSGFVNYRVYLIGGPQPLFFEGWNKDQVEIGNLRSSSSLYNTFNLLNSLHTTNEETNLFSPNFDDYSIQL